MRSTDVSIDFIELIPAPRFAPDCGLYSIRSRLFAVRDSRDLRYIYNDFEHFALLYKFIFNVCVCARMNLNESL